MDARRFHRPAPWARLALALILAFALAAPDLPGGGLGHLVEMAVFAFDSHPDLPLSGYAAGRLGILQPAYARSYLYVAYRTIDRAPLTDEERVETERYWDERLGVKGRQPKASGYEIYDAVRGALATPWQAPDDPTAGVPALQLSDDFSYLPRCGDDAFRRAAVTLEDRLRRFGPESREVHEWIVGQDFVFENCFGNRVGFLPPPPPPGLDPLIRADREYQRAAARLYSFDYDEAASAFRRIAEDAGSPLAPWGRYLAGRAMLWKSRALGPANPAYVDSLRQAAAEFREALKFEPPEARTAARRLLGRVLMRSNPVEAAAMLSGRLLTPAAADGRAGDIEQYAQLLDNAAADPALRAAIRAKDPLADWIFCFQTDAPAETEHALARWRSTQSTAWLAAVAVKLPPDHPAVPEIFNAASAVRDHPATPTLDYHRARLLAGRGDLEAARAVLEALLPSLRGLDGARNRALGLRAELARDADELLFYGLRPPALVTLSASNRSFFFRPWRLEAESAARLEPLQGRVRIGPETAAVLNRGLPLDEFAKLPELPGLPDEIRVDLLRTGWARAVALERWDLALGLADRLAQADPGMAANLREFRNAASDRLPFLGALTLLHAPGASVLVHSAPIRLAVSSEADPRGFNWWWSGEPEWTQDAPRSPAFVDENGRAWAADEWRRLRAAADGFRWLSEAVFREAERPDPHPRTPEALHRLVVALAGTDVSRGLSPIHETVNETRRRAVDLLRQRFPDSIWTGPAALALERNPQL